jgi:hypothetical protein
MTAACSNLGTEGDGNLGRDSLKELDIAHTSTRLYLRAPPVYVRLRQPALNLLWQGLKELFEHGYGWRFEDGSDHNQLIEFNLRKRHGIGKLYPIEVANPSGSYAPDAAAR